MHVKSLYIAYGWANNIVDPERKTSLSDLGSTQSLLDPAQDESVLREWKPLKEAFPWGSDSTQFLFSNAEIINYFVSRTATDGLPVCDMKSMNTSALNLFQCGHIQGIQVCCTPQNQLHIMSNCIPKMKKDRLYKVVLLLDSISGGNVVGAECGCPAGKAPRVSFKSQTWCNM